MNIGGGQQITHAATDADGKGDDEEREVPPDGDFLVLFHLPVVRIINLNRLAEASHGCDRMPCRWISNSVSTHRQPPE